jgi:tol-pal system protein YbgF
MMFIRKPLVTLVLLFSTSVTAEEIQVIELGVNSGNAQAPSVQYNTSSSSELMLIVQQLQEEVRSLRGQVEQQNYQLKQMERQQLDRYRDLDRRISGLSSQTSVNSALVAQSEATSTSAATAPEQVQPDAAPNDSTAYREAFGLVLQRNYPQATDAFNAFIKNYPDSARLPNAYYWLGEIHLAEQRPEQAREPFMQVISKFPKHNKAPDAAYKLGIVYDQLGDKAKSREYLDMVINKYPDSGAVKLATEFKRAQ